MERYARQISLPQFGEAGQARLASARVLVVGAGGLGSVLSLCLAGMGVGHLSLMDGDRVSLSNLDRQFLYTEADVGQPKALAAAARLTAQNHEIEVTPIPRSFENSDGPDPVRPYDLVLAATDNHQSRLALNAACCKAGVPLISGGVNGMYGTLQVVLPGRTPCLYCACGGQPNGENRPSPAPVVSALSALMAQAAVDLLLGQPVPDDGLLVLDGDRFTLDHIPLRRLDRCPHCGTLGKAAVSC